MKFSLHVCTPLLLGGGRRQELHYSPDVSRGQAAQLRVEAGQHLGRYIDTDIIIII